MQRRKGKWDARFDLLMGYQDGLEQVEHSKITAEGTRSAGLVRGLHLQAIAAS